MKNILTSLSLAVAIVLAGCTTIQNLTPTQIAAVGTVITQTADSGALYAIQQDKANAKYFVLADAAIDTFVTSTNQSPAELESALAQVQGTNQWVNLAVSGATVAYDLALSQYVGSAVTNSPATVAWASAIEAGFKQALSSTGTGLKAIRVSVPDFIVNGKVSKDVIANKIRSVRK